MKQSLGFFPTLREVPKEAEAKSHVLMLRGGIIRQLAAGLYIYMPLGWRAIRKIEQIVREEMDRSGAIEVHMPSMQPDTIWRESGRYEVMGPEMMRVVDRNQREFVLGPTHEEVITDLVAGELRSYRDLPKNLYQIQTKFRDEIRPRFGVVRAREFIMKDGYSFDCDDEGAAESYRKMYDAYDRIFTRCGLENIPVEADTGVMGGSLSHEFMVPSNIGEAEVVYCDSCNYKANRELTESSLPETMVPDSTVSDVEEVHTPNMKTVEEVAEFLNTTPDRMIKTMIYIADKKPVAVLLRGDHSVNEAKLAHIAGTNVEMADPDTIYQVTNAPVGFAGPVGLNDVEIWADPYIKTIDAGCSGANKGDYHIKNVVLERDFHVNKWADFRLVDEGEPCPKCENGKLHIRYGIEVGHVFILGTKYSTALNAYFTDESGQRKPMIMGCYGIGVSRTLAAVIENNCDENGIIWPVSVTPYHVHILNLSPKKEDINQACGELYNQLHERGFSVLLDDRDERPGIKFKDADLFGFPYRIVVGEKSYKDGVVEFSLRKSLEPQKFPPQECLEQIEKQFTQDMSSLQPKS